MVTVWGLTDRGKIRRENQDSCAFEVLDDKNAWGVVCDGMGGALAGDIASKLAVEQFQSHMSRLDPSGPEPGELLKTAVEEANRAVYEKASSDPNCDGMGTTLVGAALREDDLWVVNVGDSRAYYLTKDGARQITRDHSLVEELVERGNLTPEQARRHPQKNLITRALGVAPTVKVDLFREKVEKGSALLLCSDGLVNELTDLEIHTQLLEGGSPEDICRRLLEQTLAHGAYDNVTIVLFQL